MKRRGLYPEIAQEIEGAIRSIIARRAAEIRKRKESLDLLGFWITEGARSALKRPLLPPQSAVELTP